MELRFIDVLLLVTGVYHKNEVMAITRYACPYLYVERGIMYEKYLKLLEKKGVTSYQVCKATGIPENTISMWRWRVEKKPDTDPKLSMDNVAKLAKYFEVPIEYFMGD